MSISNKRLFSEPTQEETEKEDRNKNDDSYNASDTMPEHKRRKIDPNISFTTLEFINDPGDSDDDNKNQDDNTANNDNKDNENNNNKDNNNIDNNNNDNNNNNNNNNDNNTTENENKNNENDNVTKNDEKDNVKKNSESAYEPFTAEWGNPTENLTLSWDFNWKPTIVSDFDFGLSWENQDNKKKNDDDNNENNNDTFNDNYFTSQQPIAVLKGEELDSGDQQDNVLCSIKAKIYKLEKVYDNSNNNEDNNDTNKDQEQENDTRSYTSKYREKGVGLLKVTTYYNNEKQKKHARIICRRDEIHILIMNLPLLKETKFQNKENKIIITSVETNNDTKDTHLATFLIKPLESSESNNLMNAIQNAMQQIS